MTLDEREETSHAPDLSGISNFRLHRASPPSIYQSGLIQFIQVQLCHLLSSIVKGQLQLLLS